MPETVRAFAFALTLVAAGTDRGVYISADGLTWRQSGLPNTSIGALAITAVHDPVRLVAGGNVPSNTGGMPLFQSTDGGTTWRPVTDGQLHHPCADGLDDAETLVAQHEKVRSGGRAAVHSGVDLLVGPVEAHAELLTVA